jgi:pimeloyl-ACP methyl ester carboxylesterase
VCQIDLAGHGLTAIHKASKGSFRTKEWVEQIVNATVFVRERNQDTAVFAVGFGLSGDIALQASMATDKLTGAVANGLFLPNEVSFRTQGRIDLLKGMLGDMAEALLQDTLLFTPALFNFRHFYDKAECNATTREQPHTPTTTEEPFSIQSSAELLAAPGQDASAVSVDGALTSADPERAALSWAGGQAAGRAGAGECGWAHDAAAYEERLQDPLSAWRYTVPAIRSLFAGDARPVAENTKPALVIAGALDRVRPPAEPDPAPVRLRNIASAGCSAAGRERRGSRAGSLRCMWKRV